MTLVKKPYPMYYYNQKYKPPTWDFKKILLYVIIAVLVVFVLTRCNVYNKLPTHPPLTTSDSSKLSTACSKTFPVTSNDYDINIPITTDSAAYFKDKYETEKLRKQKVRDSIIYKNKYIDTSNNFGGDWDEGYSQGLKDGVDSGRSKCTYPTELINAMNNVINAQKNRIQADTFLSFSQRTQINELNKQLTQSQTASNIYKSDRNKAIVSFSILLAILLGMGIAKLINVFKPKITV